MAKNPTTEPAPDVPLVAIVDDDASVRQSTYRLARSFGYCAQSFSSSEEFLTSSTAPETACLLLDVRMPGMDGLEVQRRLAEHGERVPIVFLTAQASDDEERRARSLFAGRFPASAGLYFPGPPAARRVWREKPRVGANGPHAAL